MALVSVLSCGCTKKYQVLETKNWGTFELNDSIQGIYSDLVLYQGYLDSEELQDIMADIRSQALKRQATACADEGVTDESTIESATDALVETVAEQATSYLYLSIFTADAAELDKPEDSYSGHIIDGFDEYKKNKSPGLKLGGYTIIEDDPYDGLVIEVTNLTENKKYDISYVEDGYPVIEAVE